MAKKKIVKEDIKEDIQKGMRAVRETVPKKKKEPYDGDSPVKVRLIVSEDEESAQMDEHDYDMHADGIKRVKSESRAAEDEVFESLNGSSRHENFRVESNKKYFTICVYALVSVAIAAVVIFAIMQLPAIKIAIFKFFKLTSSFWIGFLVAFIINPMVMKLDSLLFQKLLHIRNARTSKILALLLSYAIVLGFIVIILLYVIPQITSSFVDLYNSREAIMAAVTNAMEDIGNLLPGVNLDMIEAKIAETLPQLLSNLTSIVPNLVPKIFNLSVSLVKVILNFFLTIMISVYILFDKRKLKKNAMRVLYAFVPIGKANNVSQTTKECVGVFSSFIVGKSIDSLIIGILCFIVLTIFKMPYALLVAVIVGITNMIPYFGPFIGAVPGGLLYLFIDPALALQFVIIILILQQFDGWILGPMILGDSTGLSPLWVIFAITVGGAYAGVLGMFLGVPVVAVIAFLIDRRIKARLDKKGLDIS